MVENRTSEGQRVYGTVLASLLQVEGLVGTAVFKKRPVTAKAEESRRHETAFAMGPYDFTDFSIGME